MDGVVLVVEDDPIVRMLLVEALDEIGLTVVGTADGPSGLEVLRSGACVKLLITDFSLPGGMNGREVAGAAKAWHPELAVLFITGHTELSQLGPESLGSGTHVMIKPFGAHALVTRVRELLRPNTSRGLSDQV